MDVTEVGAGANAPGLGFAGAAAASLAPVARELDTVGRRVSSGQLRLDPESARTLLAELDGLCARVRALAEREGDGIDRPLRLGDNVVAHAMGTRLRGAASGGPDAAIPVLRRFAAQLEKVRGIVATASGLVRDQDEAAAEQLGAAGRADEVEST
ncbi:hypothetical protein B1813_15245 [Saccharomonospora piscinae]|uniref:Uncharacterized protein n=1 Tax=Saccharomonospora piscinae TaxID=687388 RepID=A0A1V9A140_SACPI|nr:hypothetical protein B1813_15245 [Saccharomonospora piscinae]